MSVTPATPATRLAMVAGLSGALLVGLLPGSATAAPDGAATAAAPIPPAYAEQTLNWALCNPKAEDPATRRVECAAMTVPRDWNKPQAGVDLTIAVSRLRPETGEPIGSVVGNPGGPGGPGLGMPLLMQERPALAEKMELVGFDPRGTGSSTNITCSGAPNPAVVDARDRRQEVLDLVAKASKLYADFCHVRSGDLINYITTEQTVKDIDLIRALLGRDKIHFLGYSGGSWMGAYYATYFPQRTGNFILDSNPEFTAPWVKTFGRQPLGFERRFQQDFAPWAAKHDAVLHLGTSPGAVREFYETLRADFARRPVDVGLGILTVTMDQNAVDAEIINAGYSKLSFPVLAQSFAEFRAIWDAANTSPAAAQKLVDALPAARKQALVTSMQRAQRSIRPLSEDAFPATFAAITCNDTPWPKGQAYWDKHSAEQGRKYPIVGWSMNQNPCAYWKRPALRMPTPTGEGVPTTLMLQSVRDPATPLEGAVAAHRSFAGSRLVTVLDEGDHGVYISGNACVDAIADEFLLTGKAPAADVTCAGMPIPPPPANPALRAAGQQLSPLERVAKYRATLLG